jgi:hypothetical protein
MKSQHVFLAHHIFRLQEFMHLLHLGLRMDRAALLTITQRSCKRKVPVGTWLPCESKARTHVSTAQACSAARGPRHKCTSGARTMTLRDVDVFAIARAIVREIGKN